jgi:predicted acyltransferase|nr:heparan-alpha-glucosaminide N-acetyltransferase domain-containing protein [uncultured Emticicia sp.]
MKERLTSLDVFRGMTIMLMTIVNNPGDWGHIYAPLEHAEWHGCTPTDLVFPFFLFIVGISTVLSTNVKKFDKSVLEKIITRALRIFLLGLSLNFFSKIHLGSLEGIPLMFVRLIFTAIVTVLLLGEYDRKKQFYIAVGLFVLMILLCFGGFEDFASVRIPGVLQRIAVVYLIVSIIFVRTNTSVQIIICLACLLGYWALMALVDVPNVGAANFEKGTNLAAWLDNYLLPGHLWVTSKTWDPEGILSTIPAIGTGLAGVFTGKLLTNDFPKNKKAIYLLSAGVVSLMIGIFWSDVFPINKALWTSSYVCYAAGIALMILGALYFVIDVLEFDIWIKPFVIFGVNPMLVFFFSGIIPRVLNMIKIAQPGNLENPEAGLVAWLYSHLITPFFTEPKNASLAGALTYLVIWFIILVLFDRKKIIIKV